MTLERFKTKKMSAKKQKSKNNSDRTKTLLKKQKKISKEQKGFQTIFINNYQ